MRILIVSVLSLCLLSACESPDGKRSGIEAFFMNLGQIAFDSAKQANRPAESY